jgi:hypothetical protein
MDNGVLMDEAYKLFQRLSEAYQVENRSHGSRTRRIWALAYRAARRFDRRRRQWELHG